MRRRRSRDRGRREFSRPGSRLSRAELPQGPRVGAFAGSDVDHVALLIRRIEDNPAIVVHSFTEVVALEGGDALECITWRDNRSGHTEVYRISHTFLMTGAAPNTRWLDGCVQLDSNGFVKTGPDLTHEELASAGWPLPRRPPVAGNQSPPRVRRR